MNIIISILLGMGLMGILVDITQKRADKHTLGLVFFVILDIIVLVINPLK